MDRISSKELADLVEQLSKQYTDRDRMRIIKAAANSYSFLCEDIAELIKVQCYGPTAVQAGVLLYSVCGDKTNYADVLSIYNYDEDRNAVKSQLGL